MGVQVPPRALDFSRAVHFKGGFFVWKNQGQQPVFENVSNMPDISPVRKNRFLSRVFPVNRFEGL